MLVHSVFFWLKPELTDAQRAEFLRNLETLKGIRAIKQAYIGTPADTGKRPVVDGSYSYALTIIVDGIAGHDAYQVDPLHTAFVQNSKHFWTRVQIYDAQ
ncbi:Dabb family protein [Oleiharenicola lentus]|uniref:Dabb family protein n=1 Tax=Oleiharenicola lentus TaxID=2508720 RepID=UPI003F662C3E